MYDMTDMTFIHIKYIHYTCHVNNHLFKFPQTQFGENLNKLFIQNIQIVDINAINTHIRKSIDSNLQ